VKKRYRKKLVVLCGGTGGHFYPGLAVARYYVKYGGSAKLLISGRHSQKQSEIAGKFGIETRILPAMPTPVGLKGKVKFSALFFNNVLKQKKILKEENPDFVLGMGSFNTVPSGIAAKLLKIPLFLHDGNSYFGKANIMLSRYALHAGVAFPPVNADRLRCPYTVTGMPLRPEIYPEYWGKITGDNPVSTLNQRLGTEFSSDIPLILIFGGSQGAKTFNIELPLLLKNVKNLGFQVLHLSGPGRKLEAEDAYSGASFRYHIAESSEEIGLLYTAASLVIARAGGSTVAELALYGKTAFLIPFPYASEDHQTMNAEYYTSKGASEIIQESEVKELFPDLFRKYLTSLELMLEKSKETLSLAKPDAVEDLIEIMEKNCETGKC
jgi:UDP-N-acetylglucosamine--N-acetylmuramyl-(pentapeptide) pyrophosphoryl-undecaprenol N-acetylglucosamine transferase